MITSIIIYFCRISSILLMYLGLLIGSFCTIFILREFYFHSQFHTSLNLLIIVIFCTDCIRAFVCAPLETFVLIKTLNLSIMHCHEQNYFIQYYKIIINFCRFTMAVRSCFNVIQPFGFIAIAYERLRTIVRRNGNLNMNIISHQQRDLVRLKNIIIWIFISLLLGIIVGIYQALAYSPSNTCYGQSTVAFHPIMFILLFCMISAGLISGFIYVKMFFVLRKYQNNVVMPVIIDGNHNNPVRHQNISINDIHRKDLRLAKHSFIIFLSFFLCRLPWAIMILMDLILILPSFGYIQCYFEEFADFSGQFIFLATITDPLTYIWSQPRLKQKFSRIPIISIYFHNR
ncbi:unnamed protein product [Rotaria sp. Silwood1]|nr:unnamed protein product [Rotaria sp. Silwood1]CAF3414843.1 unnamed protein product [Rotaria sp. Silwood1]CAF3455625.1 unnamed protein product [Rotaria sp. Silwood1]CAF4520083.1 unnamed protein product [Rotaria sp. Silwood1]CAF4884317.1 unnamed protein product [Rotaria sp. Silwood1]